jgi:RimJ/RimL family protein N-acetyltransferase
MLDHHSQQAALAAGFLKSFLVVCLVEDDLRVGLVRTSNYDNQNRSIMVGADIAPQFRRQGYGTKLYTLLLDYYFNHLNMHRLWLAVLEFNVSAIGLYRKVGFQFEGRWREAVFRNGKYNDYILMSILRHEYLEGSL